MIGQYLLDPQSGTAGLVHDQTVHPDGRAVVRINDRWFFADKLQPAKAA